MNVSLAKFKEVGSLYDSLSKLIYIQTPKLQKPSLKELLALETRRRIEKDGSSYYINEISIRQGAANLAF
jgi:uncharacterized protein (UPF0216 family)